MRTFFILVFFIILNTLVHIYPLNNSRASATTNFTLVILPAPTSSLFFAEKIAYGSDLQPVFSEEAETSAKLISNVSQAKNISMVFKM